MRETPATQTLFASLVEFALWLHPTWDSDNPDDRAKAEAVVTEFLQRRTT